MNAPVQRTIITSTPNRLALDVMSKTARAAGRTWAVRRWAADLAAQAPSRNYREQLRAVYDGILERWAYVMEPDEMIYGSPDALIRWMVSTDCNAPGQSPTSINISAMPRRRKGFGDCDDVSTLVAALAVSIGMPRVYFRVARGNAGSHVSVTVITPTGEAVDVDPVGHPNHKFGWALPSKSVTYYDINTLQPSNQPLGGIEMNAPVNMPETLFVAPGQSMAGGDRNGHWAAVADTDFDGPRVLSVPMREWDLARKGVMLDGMSGVDEMGRKYDYDAQNDTWLNRTGRREGADFGNIEAFAGRGRSRSQRKAARRKRRKKIRAKFRRVVQRVGKGFRKVMSKIMNSKWVQGAIGAILQAWGVPRRLTKAVLAMGGKFIEQGGISGFIKKLRTNKKAAFQMIAAAAKSALGAAAGPVIQKLLAKMKSRRMSGFGGGVDVVPMHGLEALASHEAAGDNVGTGYVIQNKCPRTGRMSRPFRAAPIVALRGVYGALDAGADDIATSPTPGKWYRIQKGDTQVNVASRAYGTKGGENYTRQKWMVYIPANAAVIDPANKNNMWPTGRISFMPRWASDPAAAIRGESGNAYAVIWLPEHEGDNPPDVADDPVDDDPTRGPRGLPGLPGEAGSPGLPGSIGPAGQAGGRGPAGPIGPAGPGGEGDGQTGPAGDQGIPGIQGEVGPAGIPGIQGEQGPPGQGAGDPVPGPQGEPGPRGVPGVGGEQGVPGIQGPPGEGGTGGGRLPPWAAVLMVSFLGGGLKF